MRVSNANAYWYVSSPVASPGPASLQNATVTVEDAVYTGEAVAPQVTVTLGGAALAEGKDYTVSCVGTVEASMDAGQSPRATHDASVLGLAG